MYFESTNVHGLRALGFAFVRTHRCVLVSTMQVPFLRDVQMTTYLHGLNSRIEFESASFDLGILCEHRQVVAYSIYHQMFRRNGKKV